MNIRELAKNCTTTGKAEELAEKLNTMLESKCEKLVFITSENKYAKIFQIVDEEMYNLYINEVAHNEINEYVYKCTKENFGFVVSDFSLAITKQNRLTIKVFC